VSPRLATALLVLLLPCGPARADFEEALRAYDRGDYVAAAAAWRPLAEAGDPAAQTNLGVLYWRGRGVSADPAQAARWFRLAAERGDPVAQDNLGQMYYVGDGVPRDLEQAARWIRASALQGDANAQLRLGSLYADGIGVERDPQRAVMWWRKAAEQNHPEAQVRLGIAYERGSGVPRDPAQAQHWFDRAARPSQARPPDALARPVQTPPSPTPLAAFDVAAAPRKSFVVQIASVGSSAAAHAEWERLRRRHPDLLGDLSLDVERADLGPRGVFYRVRAGPLRDRTGAETLCRRLQARQQGCLVR
jgi:hypothetical protein